MFPVQLSLFALFLAISVVAGLPWDDDQRLPPLRKISLVTANSSLPSFTIPLVPPSPTKFFPSINSTGTPPVACSGSVVLYGSPPKTQYTTITHTHTTTGYRPFFELPTYITPPPPCATLDCRLGHNGTCPAPPEKHTRPVLAPSTTLISITKKTTIYQSPSSVMPPDFSRVKTIGETRPPVQQTALPNPGLGDLASWIDSIIDQLRPSSVQQPSTQTQQNEHPEITEPPNSQGDNGSKGPGTGVPSDVDQSIGPDSKTTLRLAGMPVTVSTDNGLHTIVYGEPPTTFTVGPGSTPMTLTGGIAGLPVTFTVNPTGIIHDGTTLPLQPSQSTVYQPSVDSNISSATPTKQESALEPTASSTNGSRVTSAVHTGPENSSTSGQTPAPAGQSSAGKTTTMWPMLLLPLFSIAMF